MEIQIMLPILIPYLRRPKCFLTTIGNYWIDPNGGVSNDAVLAHCQFESSATCVIPKKLEVVLTKLH
jgi:hypothetical protein